MAEVIGTVKKVHVKTGGGSGGKKPWKKFSILLLVDGSQEEVWYSAGFGAAPKGRDGNEVEEGHRVKFQSTTSEYGEEITENTIVISAGEKVAVAPTSRGGNGGGKGGYTDRNTSIVIQSARKDALQFIDTAVTLNALPVNKGKTPGDVAKRYVELLALTDKLTVRFARDLVTEIAPEEFRVFGVVQDAFGEGETAPLPAEAAAAPSDLTEPPAAGPDVGDGGDGDTF